MNKEILIRGENLKKYFPVKGFFSGRTRFIKAVDNVTLAIRKGETFGLVGESGCGKSTLGRTLIRMLDVTDGKLYYKGREITRAKDSQLKDFHNKMQIIFQDTYSALNPFWNVEEILAEPLRGIGMPEGERRDRMEYLLHKVGMKSEDLQRFPHEFSGGQRQRIGIARALSVQPEFILCDEPIAALDVSIQAQVVNMLEDLQQEFGLTYLFAAHDLSMVRYISTRIGVMYLGSLVELADSRPLYEEPLHPYTRALLSAIPIPDPKKARLGKRIHLEGEIPNPLDVPEGCRFAPRCAYATGICKEVQPEFRMLKENHFVACHHV